MSSIDDRRSATASHRRRAWIQVVLVFAFMLINYADKSVVGLASVPIMRDMGLTHAQFGALGSAFFALFSVSGVVVGFIANHVRTKLVMLVMALVWALALLPMTLSSSFTLLLASRVILGAAEGPSFPVALHAVYKWFPDERRALPTSVVASGAAVGTGVIAPLISWIVVRYGWHAAFGTLGLAGLLWSLVWALLAREGGDAQTAVRGIAPVGTAPDAPRVAYRRLLLSRTALGVFIAGFGAYWLISLNIVWLANYLIKVMHVSSIDSGWIIAVPSLLQVVLAPSLAALSQRFIRGGKTSRHARGGLGAACVIAGGAALIVMAQLPMGPLKIAFIGLAFSLGSVFFTLGSTLIGEISPQRQRGALLGITNSIHTLAGLVAPVLMGVLIERAASLAQGFAFAFMVSGTLVIVAGILAALLIDPAADLRRLH